MILEPGKRYAQILWDRPYAVHSIITSQDVPVHDDLKESAARQASAFVVELPQGSLVDTTYRYDMGSNAFLPPAEPPIEEVKEKINEAINRERKKKNTTSFMFRDHPVSADALSRSDIDGIGMYVALYNRLPAKFPGFWKAEDNFLIPIAGPEDIREMIAAMVDEGIDNFIKAQELKGSLKDAKTPQEAKSVRWRD